jgi:uncharacterized membrane protein YtjA (UPF0391 family)
MLYYALVFLVVGLIAGALNLAGVSAVAVQISWILFVIGVVLVVIHLVTGRSTRVGSGGVLVYGVWIRGRAWLQSLLASLLSLRVAVRLGAYARYGS